MSEFDNILSKTKYSTSETAHMVISNNEDLSKIANSFALEEKKLAQKYSSIQIPKDEMMKIELESNLKEIITLMEQDYGEFIPEDRLARLKNMASGNGVVVINDVNDKHDFSANSEKGKVTVNLARIAKNDKNPNPDIYRQMAAAEGTLPHELFHIVIQMLKPSELADKQMNINLKNGETISSRGMSGFMINEGFVEKFAEDFCKRNNIYYSIAPQYSPYIDICNYIMENNQNVNDKTIFSLDGEECLAGLTPEERKKYDDAEAVSFAVRHKGKKADDIVSSSLDSINIDTKDIPKERLLELERYYYCKREKLTEVSENKEVNIHK